MAKELDIGTDQEISAIMRDYLAEIYRVGLGKMWVSTTAVAERLNVSSPATVRMIGRLKQRGLVEHQPYQGVLLTETGKKQALLGIRRHRLVERFLVDVLQFGWHEAHDEADILDKGINQRLEDRIDALMNYPTACPHGEPIPSRDGEIREVNDRPLTVIAAGASGKISRIRTREADKLVYLAEIGLVPGIDFILISREPFNGPLRLKLGNQEQVVGGEIAQAIWVT